MPDHHGARLDGGLRDRERGRRVTREARRMDGPEALEPAAHAVPGPTVSSPSPCRQTTVNRRVGIQTRIAPSPRLPQCE